MGLPGVPAFLRCEVLHGCHGCGGFAVRFPDLGAKNGPRKHPRLSARQKRWVRRQERKHRCRLIQLTQEKFAMVDRKYFARLNQYLWISSKGYAARRGRRGEGARWFYMHNVILEPPPNKQIDHRNLNPLDNRRRNLRPSTKRENGYNRFAPRFQNKSSRFKGVYYHNQRRRWAAIIVVNGRGRYLGLFSDERDAAMAYNRNAQRHFGKFARLNVL